jgi:hypothetical protein
VLHRRLGGEKRREGSPESLDPFGLTKARHMSVYAFPLDRQKAVIWIFDTQAKIGADAALGGANNL